MKPTHPAWFVLLAVLFLAPCLFGGGFYAAGDLVSQYLPDQLFLRGQLLRGHFPLWNPYVFGGQPFAADPNNMAFYPFHLLSLALPGVWAALALLAFHLVCSGWGMSRWLETTGVDGLGRWLGAGVYMASGFASYEVGHPPVIGAYAFFPWVLAYMERLSKEPGDRLSAFKVGLAGALVVLSGNPQTALGVFYASVLYFVARSWHHHRFAAWWKPGNGSSLASVLFGLLPVLALVIPFTEWKPMLSRSGEVGDYLGFNAVQSLRPTQLYRLFFPLHPTIPLRGVDSEDPYLMNLAYVGWVPLLLMLGALQDRGRRALVVCLTLMGLVGWLLAFGRYTPFHEWVCRFVPGMKWNRAPFRFLFLWTMAASFLAGLGFQSWSAWNWKNGDRRFVDVVVPVLFAVWCIAAIRYDAFGFWEVVVSAAGVLAWFAYRWGRPAFAGILLTMAVLGPLAVPFWRMNPVSNSDIYRYEKRLPWLSSLRETVGTSRILLEDTVMYPDPHGGPPVVWTPNAGMLCSLRNVGGYNPLTNMRTMDTRRLPFPVFNRLWALKCFVTGKKYKTLPGFERLTLGEYFGFRYIESHPMVYVPSEVRWVGGEEEALHGLLAPGSDPYRLSYLNGVVSGSKHQAGRLGFNLESSVTDVQHWNVNREGSGWVVFSEVMFPGWTARLDGKAVPIVTANSVFRAVWVPAGEHRVEFVYRPFWWPWIPIGALLWTILALVGGSCFRKGCTKIR